MSRLEAEKLDQAVALLDELGLDCWLTLVRESAANPDPALRMIYPGDLTWISALLVGRGGSRTAIVGRYDADRARGTALFDRVVGYDESIRAPLVEALDSIEPTSIAINYSTGDVLADGLSHGLYLMLVELLEGTPYVGRLRSAEPLVAALRGRKSPGELARVRAAIETTDAIYASALEWLRPGLSEREIAAFFHAALDEAGLATAWERAGCPTVNAGPQSPVGHTSPSELTIERGQLLHLDFGLRRDGYCSDVQRAIYFLAEGEDGPPEELLRAFAVVRRALEAARAALRPGAIGHEVDAVARAVVTDAGYPGYRYATGHQLGREVHDGGTLIGPIWPRYGRTPFGRVELGQVYTLEPGLALPGFGYIGLEEDVVVTERGGEYLGQVEDTLWVIAAR